MIDFESMENIPQIWGVTLPMNHTPDRFMAIG